MSSPSRNCERLTSRFMPSSQQPNLLLTRVRCRYSRMCVTTCSATRSTIRRESRGCFMTEAPLTYLQAIVEAQREEMLRDERVILIGEDIAVYQGKGLFDSFD